MFLTPRALDHQKDSAVSKWQIFPKIPYFFAISEDPILTPQIPKNLPFKFCGLTAFFSLIYSNFKIVCWYTMWQNVFPFLLHVTAHVKYRLRCQILFHSTEKSCAKINAWPIVMILSLNLKHWEGRMRNYLTYSGSFLQIIHTRNSARVLAYCPRYRRYQKAPLGGSNFTWNGLNMLSPPTASI